MLLQQRHNQQVRYDPQRRRLEGVVVPYNVIEPARDANTGRMVRERILPGAMVPDEDLSLNLQHLGNHVVSTSVQLRDGDDALRMTAALDGPDADLAISLLERETLRGLSSEFVDLERREEGGVSTVVRAQLNWDRAGRQACLRIADATVQLRVGQSWQQGVIPTDVELPCACLSQADCDRVRFNRGAFNDVISGEQGETIVTPNEFASAFASQRRGSLQLSEGDGGRLMARFPITQELVDRAGNVDLVVRPVIDQERSRVRRRRTECAGTRGSGCVHSWYLQQTTMMVGSGWESQARQS